MALMSIASSTAQAENKAVDSGQVMQGFVRRILKPAGFTFVTYAAWEKYPEKFSKLDKVVLTEIPYTSIYGHEGRMPFLLKAKNLKKDVYIIPRIQNVSGSVDEKLPYFYYNYKQFLPEHEVMLVLAGQGWKPEAVEWLRKNSEDTQGFQVLNHEQFEAWIAKTF